MNNLKEFIKRRIAQAKSKKDIRLPTKADITRAGITVTVSKAKLNPITNSIEMIYKKNEILYKVTFKLKDINDFDRLYKSISLNAPENLKNLGDYFKMGPMFGELHEVPIHSPSP